MATASGTPVCPPLNRTNHCSKTPWSRLVVHKASGKLESRPALDAMFDQLRPRDSFTVWRLDRLGRSLRHLIDTVADLEARGVAFRSLTEAIDTSTPGGKLTFHAFRSTRRILCYLDTPRCSPPRCERCCLMQ